MIHEQDIIDTILASIDTTNCEVKAISLVCNTDTLQERLKKDIKNGIRTNDIIERSIARISLYDKLNDGKCIISIVKEIISL